MATNPLALAFSFGIVSHVFLFSRGEWDRFAPKVLFAHILLCTAIFTALLLNYDRSFTQCIVEAYRIDSALIAGLSTSILTYRLIFHPLRSFPGPFAARVSSLWAFREQWPDLRFYIKLRNTHDRYGDFVRISKVMSH